MFVTGAAGSGKSYLLKAYLSEKKVPVLASTGSAAILVGGRTFHSFFGLGIMEGGVEATIERALKNKRLASRMRNTDEVVIDEVSMLSGPTLRAAEGIARKARDVVAPWGGMRIIAVGDFAQLPPVSLHGKAREWAFLDPVWAMSDFRSVELLQVMRTSDAKFLEVLNRVRLGDSGLEVKEFLDERSKAQPGDGCTRLFSRREDVERFNLERLSALKSTAEKFETIYTGKTQDVENFKRNAPIPDVIQLKKEALVMLRQNDPESRYVNGSLGTVKEIAADLLTIKLLTGRTVEIKKVDFTLLSADGLPVVTARNFPVNLAWAMTIHKAQGTTVDRLRVDLRRLWEPGQAYVALSRCRSTEGLSVEGWNPQSIIADPEVRRFHAEMGNH